MALIFKNKELKQITITNVTKKEQNKTNKKRAITRPTGLVEAWNFSYSTQSLSQVNKTILVTASAAGLLTSFCSAVFLSSMIDALSVENELHRSFFFQSIAC